MGVVRGGHAHSWRQLLADVADAAAGVALDLQDGFVGELPLRVEGES